MTFPTKEYTCYLGNKKNVGTPSCCDERTFRSKLPTSLRRNR